MHINFQDPMFLIPAGAIVIGVVLLPVMIGKLIKKTPPPPDFLSSDGSFPPAPPDDLIREPSGADFLPFNSRRDPPMNTPPQAAGGGNHEMADRLDGMAQKLSDMQTVLQRQVAAAPAGAALTPETIDKLLKIIGNVTQQVDVLQKSLASSPSLGVPTPGITPAAPSLSASTPPAPAAPQAAPLTKPTATPAPPVGGKSLGMTGGALSSFGRPATPPAQKPAAPPTPPPTEK